MKCNSILTFVSQLLLVNVGCSFWLCEKWRWSEKKMGNDVQNILFLDCLLRQHGLTRIWGHRLVIVLTYSVTLAESLQWGSAVPKQGKDGCWGQSLLLWFREESLASAVVLLSVISIKVNIIVDVRYWSVFIYIYIVSGSTSRKTNIPSLPYWAIGTICLVKLKFLVSVIRSMLYVDQMADFANCLLFCDFFLLQR